MQSGVQRGCEPFKWARKMGAKGRALLKRCEKKPEKGLRKIPEYAPGRTYKCVACYGISRCHDLLRLTLASQ